MIPDDIYRDLISRHDYPDVPRVHTILRTMLRPEEVELLLELPAEPELLAERLGHEEGDVKRRIRSLLQRGLLISTDQGFIFPPSIGVLHDTALASHPDHVPQAVYDAWRRYYQEEWSRDLGESLVGADRPYYRIVPTLRALDALKAENPDAVLPHEDLRAFVAGQEVIALRQCACRSMNRSCDHLTETCLLFGCAAEYSISRGAGRSVSPDEALHLLRDLEASGLVHLVANRLDNHMMVCNCCKHDCVILNAGLYHGGLTQALARSPYRAVLDGDFCIGCGTCVDSCNFEAIELAVDHPGSDLTARIDEERCWGCGVCVDLCDQGSISLVRTSTNSEKPGDVPSFLDRWRSIGGAQHW